MIPYMYILLILGIALVLLLCHLFVLQIVLVDLLSVLSSCMDFLVPRTREKKKISIRIRQKTSPIHFFRTKPKRSRVVCSLDGIRHVVCRKTVGHFGSSKLPLAQFAELQGQNDSVTSNLGQTPFASVQIWIRLFFFYVKFWFTFEIYVS